MGEGGKKQNKWSGLFRIKSGLAVWGYRGGRKRGEWDEKARHGASELRKDGERSLDPRSRGKLRQESRKPYAPEPPGTEEKAVETATIQILANQYSLPVKRVSRLTPPLPPSQHRTEWPSACLETIWKEFGSWVDGRHWAKAATGKRDAPDRKRRGGKGLARRRTLKKSVLPIFPCNR